MIYGFLVFPNSNTPLLHDMETRQVSLVVNATTGKVLYIINVTGKTVHPSDNGYNPLIVNGVIYELTINGTIMALN